MPPAYIQNQPTGAKVVESKFQLREKGALPDTLQPPELGFVLDRSASMSSLVNEAVTGFNTLVDDSVPSLHRPTSVFRCSITVSNCFTTLSRFQNYRL